MNGDSEREGNGPQYPRNERKVRRDKCDERNEKMNKNRHGGIIIKGPAMMEENTRRPCQRLEASGSVPRNQRALDWIASTDACTDPQRIFGLSPAF